MRVLHFHGVANHDKEYAVKLKDYTVLGILCCRGLPRDREKASGARADRPKLLRMIAALQPGEVVVAEEMDRISQLPLSEAEQLGGWTQQHFHRGQSDGTDWPTLGACERKFGELHT
jgi:hypothetical protein